MEDGLATPHDEIYLDIDKTFVPRCDDGKPMIWFIAGMDMA